jgi:hypothetical protein
VSGGWLRAAGAGRQYAPAALDERFWAAPSTPPLELTMHPLLRFRTSVLDVSRERPNPINPIPGELLLRSSAIH